MGQSDIINQLAGVEAGSALAGLREQRPETLQYAQGSFLALFEPDDPAGVSLLERDAIGLRVATLEMSPVVAAHQRARLQALDASGETIAAIEGFPDSGDLPARLQAILRHADLLTMAPRKGSPQALERLKAAGLTTRDIVTVSQIVAFLSYQIRMVALLQAMEDSG